MKSSMSRLIALVCLLIASFGWVSCARNYHNEKGDHYPSGVSYRVGNTMPEKYLGSVYFYKGRYYSGGRYETGKYRFKGKIYYNRYYYGKGYLYGGVIQPKGNS